MGGGLVVIRNEEKGGIGKVTEKVDVVGNRKRLKVAAASAFLIYPVWPMMRCR